MKPFPLYSRENSSCLSSDSVQNVGLRSGGSNEFMPNGVPKFINIIHSKITHDEDLSQSECFSHYIGVGSKARDHADNFANLFSGKSQEERRRAMALLEWNHEESGASIFRRNNPHRQLVLNDLCEVFMHGGQQHNMAHIPSNNENGTKNKLRPVSPDYTSSANARQIDAANILLNIPHYGMQANSGSTNTKSFAFHQEDKTEIRWRKYIPEQQSYISASSPPLHLMPRPQAASRCRSVVNLKGRFLPGFRPQL